MEQRQMQKSIPLYTLIILMSFAAVAAVLFTPGLPQIQRQFQIGADDIQLTVSLFLLGYAIGPLFYGPLANRYGRKNALYLGITISFFSTLFCAVAPYLGNFPLFLVARFMLAIGTSVGLTIAFTIINDVFTELEQRSKMISYATLAFAVMPGLAIYAGGLLVEYWGWQSCFYVYVPYCLLVAFLVFRLPETKPPHLENMDLKTMFIHYYQVGRDGKLWLYSIIWGITSGIIFTFSAIMPLISQNSLHLPADVFSTYNLWVFAGLAVGNILSAKLAVFFNPKKIMIMGIIVSLSGAILFLISTLSSHLTAAHLFLWNTLLFLGLPAIFCNALALATARSSDTATASSLITSIDLCVAILVLSSMSLFTNHMAAMMSSLFVIMLISVTLLFYWVGRR